LDLHGTIKNASERRERERVGGRGKDSGRIKEIHSDWRWEIEEGRKMKKSVSPFWGKKEGVISRLIR